MANNTERKWTPSQQQAIDARNCELLVTAAAGSGKTSVLTERVKNLLIDPVDPCDVSELLVVTFTRDAAEEMRSRIADALSGTDREKLVAELPTADICTIDAFVQKVVRDHFNSAGVSADFRILDDMEQAILLSETIEEVIEDAYAQNRPGFAALVNRFVDERDDTPLTAAIRELYKISRSQASPEQWIADLAAVFRPGTKPDDTPYTDAIYRYYALCAQQGLNRLNRAEAVLSGYVSDPLVDKDVTKNLGHIDDLRIYFAQLLETTKNKDWDALIRFFKEGGSSLSGRRFGRYSKAEDAPEYAALSKLTDIVSKIYKFSQDIAKTELPTTEEHLQDLESLSPMVGELCQLTLDVTRRLFEVKQERNAYYFDDLLHLCLNLLRAPDGGDTEVARDLREQYRYILIDEYQDTNPAQDTIFKIISRDETNLFFVGDAKQSIYVFRNADPELFIEKRNRFAKYEKDATVPSYITLEENFRSRKEILDAVNAVFSAVMSPDVGQMTYGEEERLNYAAGETYDADKTNQPRVELWYFDEQARPDDPSKIKGIGEMRAYEAERIARFIAKEVADGKTVHDSKKGERPVRYSDFAILLRQFKNRSRIYEEALARYGIPFLSETETNVSQSPEVLMLRALLQVVNNPTLDVPLVAVLLSPLFGFTADEMTEIRLAAGSGDLYTGLLALADTNAKIKSFLKKLSLYRNIAAAYSIADFVRFTVEDSALIEIYSANGGERGANIRAVLRQAEAFTERGQTGLASFLRYLDKLLETGAIKATGNVSGANAVRLLTIHKSKGLEFPYVILADCSCEYNDDDNKTGLYVSGASGIGMVIRDDERFSKYPTLSVEYNKMITDFRQRSEELRVLYVAMTRAKERLIFCCSASARTHPLKKVFTTALLDTDKNGIVDPMAVLQFNSYSEILLSLAARGRCGDGLRELCNLDPAEGEVPLELTINVTVDKGDGAADGEIAPAEPPVGQVNAAKLQAMKDKTAWSYPYPGLATVLAKRTASSAEKGVNARRFFATEKPHFLSDSMTGADRGTAVHKFLELCDFREADRDLDAEIARLKDALQLTPEEIDVLDTGAVTAFLQSSVGRRLLASPEVLKEYEFSVLRKAGDLYDGLTPTEAVEEVVVQGKLDCAFIEDGAAVLIDYKTDKTTDEEVYRSTYAPQLAIYADALTQCRGVPVKEIYIYSFTLKKFIAL